jgi:hypothetical protein
MATNEKAKNETKVNLKVRRSITAEFPPKWNFENIGDSIQVKKWKTETTVIEGREANFLIATLLNNDKVSIPLGANLKKIIENLNETLLNEPELADELSNNEIFIEISYVKTVPSKFKSNPTKIFKAEILEY